VEVPKMFIFDVTKVPYFVKRSRQLKNVKRVCLKRIIKRQENELVRKNN